MTTTSFSSISISSRTVSWQGKTVQGEGHGQSLPVGRTNPCATFTGFLLEGQPQPHDHMMMAAPTAIQVSVPMIDMQTQAQMLPATIVPVLLDANNTMYVQVPQWE